MRIILPVLTAIVLAGLAAAQSVTPRTALDEIIDRASAEGFSGAVLVGDLEGVTYQRLVPSPSSEPRRMDELWRWAGVTRQITAILIMQEVEKKRVLLDAVVTSYLPEFTGPTGSILTLRQLLQHNSGLPDLADDFHEVGSAPNIHRMTGLGACAGPVQAQPGERLHVSDCDYLVLGAVLEAVTGQDFEDLVAARIAAPAGASGLRVAPSVRADLPRLVAGPDIEARPGNPATYGAGGSLFGTPGDLLRIDVALMIGRYLGAPSLRALWTATPHLGNAALGAKGYAVALTGCGATVDLIEGEGSIGGTQVRNIIAPRLGRVLIVFSNGRKSDLGDAGTQDGLVYDLLNAGFCTAAG